MKFRRVPGAKKVPMDYPAPVPKPVPAFAPRHAYGGHGTIHRTGTIDIQQDAAGNVVCVWFRCLSLPFRASRDASPESFYNPSDRVAIEEIIYVDLPDEEDS